MRPTARAGVMKDGRRFGRPPKPVRAAGDAAGQDQRHRPGLAQRQDAARLGAGLQRPGGRATSDQIVIAAEVTTDSPDFGHLEPMVDAAAATSSRPPASPSRPRSCSPTPATGTRSRWNALAGDGITVLIPPDAGKRKGARPGWDGGLYAFMRRVLATDARRRALRANARRMIEPVFADTKFNRRIDRFQRRGRSACRSEWRLITATHNLAQAPAAHHRPRRPPDGPAGRGVRRPSRRDADLTNHTPHRDCARSYATAAIRAAAAARFNRRWPEGARYPRRIRRATAAISSSVRSSGAGGPVDDAVASVVVQAARARPCRARPGSRRSASGRRCSSARRRPCGPDPAHLALDAPQAL